MLQKLEELKSNALQELESMCRDILKAKPKEDTSIIEVAVGSKRWRARLSANAAAFVEAQRTKDVFLVTRSDVVVEDRTKPGKDPKKRPVTLHLGDRDWKCKIDQEYFRRLTEWKDQEREEGT